MDLLFTYAFFIFVFASFIITILFIDSNPEVSLLIWCCVVLYTVIDILRKSEL
jgi:hypothetical protein